MAATSGRSLDMYLSYAQKDEALKQEFEDYLTILQQAQLITGWVERQVQPGRDWSREVDQRILAADLVLLLLSPALLASGYCSGAEFSQAFAKRKEGTVHVIPILLHAVDLTGYPLASILALPRNAIPISSWPNHSEAWQDVDQEIRSLMKHIQSKTVK